jgi:RND family efflux transporter MFP subunit
MSKHPRLARFVWLVALLVALAAMTACGGKKDEQAEAAVDLALPVEVVTAGQGQSAGELQLTGTLEPTNQTPIGSEVGGTVRAIYVEVGDRVKRGQPLASLDLTDFQLTVQQAEAAYHSAVIAFETAEKDYQRFTNLNQEGSISPSDYEKAVLGYKAASYNMKQAEAMLGMARNRLNNAVIRAPYDGQVTQRVVNLGSFVDAMTHPVMFVMIESRKLRVTLKLPEARAALLEPGDEIKLFLPSSQRTFTLPIAVITDSVDPMTHTRTALAWLDNSGADAVPAGLFFEASILPSSLRGKILLPSTAVREESGKFNAYVVQGNKAAVRPITGRFLADHSEFVVDSGVAPGDQVITEASMVRDGQTIAVRGAAAPAATPAPEAAK